jgi:hypothetical protein
MIALPFAFYPSALDDDGNARETSIGSCS